MSGILRTPVIVAWRALRLACLLGALLPDAARANPWEFIPVGDRIEEELRLLEVASPDTLTARRLLRPHLGLRPLLWAELEGDGAPVDGLPPATGIAMARIERALGRERREAFAPHPRFGSTPRLVETGALGARLEIAGGIDGGIRWNDRDTEVRSLSGVRAIFGVQIDRWLYHSDLLMGEVEHARTFADPLITDTDLILHTEDTWLAWAAEDARWVVQFGRSRWHWGPGEEGSLVLSRTSAALTALSYRVRIPVIRADVAALSATLDPSAGEQLAAHRVEWNPLASLRVGLTETARYHSDTWQPLYLVGAIPFVLAQRLQWQDEPDSLLALRNNVQMASDLAWRIAPGTRVYAELLVDDLHAKTARVPNKLAWQVGWEGVGAIGSQRLSWGGELTRLSRYVYTSFFGRDYESQGRPLGFPTGPDSRRLRLRVAWDPSIDLQAFARVTRTDKGENDLDEPFVPGITPPGQDVWSFEGVVERTRELEFGARWWPASGVDVSVSLGWQWRENLAHVDGAREDGPAGAFALRWMR